MHVIRVRNVQAALPAGLKHLAAVGVPMSSRAGDVLVAPGPVTTVYEKPNERVLFWPERDANPFFHLFEALWLLAGRDDLAFIQRFVKRMESFSIDSKTLSATYGVRWRRHFKYDQLERVVELLKNKPMSRRAVITMWDPRCDLEIDEASPDVPCNTQMYLTVMYGRRDEPNQLHAMVTCRSNDIIWGAYGANAVQFSMLQEYLAARLGLMLGNLTQVSWNFHAYDEVYRKTYQGDLLDGWYNPYQGDEVTPQPLVTNPEVFDYELKTFLDDPTKTWLYQNSFILNVARPLWFAHAYYKDGKFTEALNWIERCSATDWARAAREWLIRR